MRRQQQQLLADVQRARLERTDHLKAALSLIHVDDREARADGAPPRRRLNFVNLLEQRSASVPRETCAMASNAHETASAEQLSV